MRQLDDEIAQLIQNLAILLTDDPPVIALAGCLVQTVTGLTAMTRQPLT